MTSNSMLRTRWAAVGAAVAVTLGAVGLGGLNIASADVADGDRPVFIPVNPCRLVDTRTTSPVGSGATVTITAHGENGECTGASAIPTDAVSLSLNVTAVGATASTFLTFWGDGANPGTSNLNPRPGAAPTPNSVNTPLSTSGTFNVYNDAGAVNIIADVNGYYANHNHDDRYEVLPTRLTVAPGHFEPTSTTGTWRQARNGTLYHAGTPEPVCARAPLEIPAGHAITDAEVTYIAYDENDETTFEIISQVAEAGTYEYSAYATQLAVFSGTLQPTPLGGAGAAPDSQILEGQSLTVDGGSATIDDERTHYVQVCTADQLEFYAFHVDIAPAP